MASSQQPPEPITPPEGDDELQVEPLQHDLKHADIPYSADFTDSLMERLLNSESPQTSGAKRRSAIRVIARNALDTSATQEQGKLRQRTVPLSSIDINTLPKVERGDLPLSLDDVRRVYTSAIPGILLTHPGGVIEGGSSTASFEHTPLSMLEGLEVVEADTVMGGTADEDNTAQDRSTSNDNQLSSLRASLTYPLQAASTSQYSPYTTFVRQFLIRHPSINTSTELQQAIAAETETQLEALRERMREREEAVRKNAEVQKKIAELVTEREFERKVMEGWRRKRSSKGEAIGVGG